MTTAEDLLDLTAELVDIPSVSLEEAAIADYLEARLRRLDHLEVTRIGHNVVARTHLGRDLRLVLAGHTDTVPPAGNERSRRQGDTLWGVGTADMKGGLAVFLAVAAAVDDPAVDLTLVFYVAEEVAAEHSGLAQLIRDAPALLAADAAILGDPPDGAVEAGCQGTMRLAITVTGHRAHTARPWMGVNAIHRLGPILDRIATYEPRTPVLAGCEYREALQAVAIEGGVAGNVVPDHAVLTVNHRFAPDRSATEAEAHLRSLFAGVDGVEAIEVLDEAPGAPPSTDHPLLSPLAARLGVRAKLGWTDVARFADLGVPAINLGPGDSTLAHTPDERVTGDQLARTFAALVDLLAPGGVD